jgi:ethanolamine utilization protein EutA
MADHLAQALHLKKADADHAGLYTNGFKPLPDNPTVRALTFSGGVADYVYNASGGDLFRYGDVGILLGESIRKSEAISGVELLEAEETIRATVVGAGIHTIEISGSTICYAKERLPLKNVPILKISEEDERSLETFRTSIRSQLPFHMPEGEAEPVAIAFTGRDRTAFTEVQALAEAIINGAQEVIKSRHPLILVVENDIAKALGHALNVQLRNQKDLVCVDGIRTLGGDYIDIGEPVGGGQVVPVVIKTLVFNT